MKNKIQLLKKTAIIIAFMTSAHLVSATNFTAIANGDFSSSSTWQGGVAPNSTLGDNDIVTIDQNLTVNLDQDLMIDGTNAMLMINGDLSGSKNIHLTKGSLSGSGVMNVNDFTIETTGIFLFSGNASANNFYNNSVLVLISDINVKQNLYLNAGKLSLSSNLTLNDNANIIFDGGELAFLSGLLNLNGEFNITYKGTSKKIGMEAAKTGLKTLVINLSNSADDITLQNDITVFGKLDIQRGNLKTNDKNITVTGYILTNANATISGTKNSDILINGNNNSTLLFHTTDNKVKNLIINNDDNNQSVTLFSNIDINGDLDLKNGNLVLNNNTMTLLGAFGNNGSGYIVGSNNSSIVLMKNGDMGTLMLDNNNSSINNLTINGGKNSMVTLGSNLTILNNLNLDNGKIALSNSDLKLSLAAIINSYSKDNYIMTSGTGSLILNVDNSASGKFFPVGNSNNYAPIIVFNKKGDAEYKVRVSEIVYANGTTGSDLSLTGKMVKNTWFVENTSTTDVDVDLKVMWSAAMEVNSFNRNSAYLSHYMDAKWDVTANIDITTEANGMFAIKRTGITSLSPFAVKDGGTAGIAKTNLVSVNVYPNPTNNFITIESATSSNSEISITDMLGREVINTNLSNNQIDVSGLTTGVYIIKINGEQVSKFSKQ